MLVYSWSTSIPSISIQKQKNKNKILSKFGKRLSLVRFILQILILIIIIIIIFFPSFLCYVFGWVIRVEWAVLSYLQDNEEDTFVGDKHGKYKLYNASKGNRWWCVPHLHVHWPMTRKKLLTVLTWLASWISSNPFFFLLGLLLTHRTTFLCILYFFFCGREVCRFRFCLKLIEIFKTRERKQKD